MKPHTDSGKLKIQPRLRSPWISGVADALTEDEDGKTVSIYEIKASQDRNWVENALIQVIMYALMLGKTWYRLHLFNPFQNQKISYYFNTKKLVSLRKELLQDVLVYNINSFMAKTYPDTKDKKSLDVSNTLFLNIIKDEHGNIKQASILNMLSPIKTEFVYSKYASSGENKTKNMSKEDRFACESALSSDDIMKEVKDILYAEVHKNKVIWSFEDYNDIIFTNSIKSFYNLNSFDDIVNHFEYKRNEELMYSADFTDSLFRNIFCLSFLFSQRHFV